MQFRQFRIYRACVHRPNSFSNGLQTIDFDVSIHRTQPQIRRQIEHFETMNLLAVHWKPNRIRWNFPNAINGENRHHDRHWQSISTDGNKFFFRSNLRHHQKNKISNSSYIHWNFAITEKRRIIASNSHFHFMHRIMELIPRPSDVLCIVNVYFAWIHTVREYASIVCVIKLP